MTFVEDHWESYDAPALELHLLHDDDETPFLLLTGPEPDLQWERFIAAVAGLAARLDVRLTVGLNSIPMAVPHTRPTGVTAHATRPELIAGYEPWLQRVQVPGSVGHLLEFRLGEQGRDALGFAVHVPHYVAQTEYPAAAEVLLTSVSRSTGLLLPGEGLRVRRRGGPGGDRPAGRPDRGRRRPGPGPGGAVRRVRPRARREEPARRRTPARCPPPTNSAPSWNGSWPSRPAPATPRAADPATRGCMGQAGDMRLATWNVNSVKARLPRLLEWLAGTAPDVVCLQETKCPDDAFPVAEVGDAGLHRGQPQRRPVERGGDPVPGRPGRRPVGLRRRAGLPRAGGPGHLRHLRRGAGLVGVRAERPDARRPALRVQAGLVRGAARRAGRRS